MEVTDFYEHIKPRQFEERLRAKVVEDLNKVVILRLRGFNDCSMYPFGSYMSGLYLPTGDMDIAFCSRGYIHGGVQRAPSKSQIRKFADFVRSERLAVNNKVEGILHARVPLVKYVDKKTGLKMDISFENTSGIVATTTFKTWKEQWPVMPTLVTVIKQYLLMRALNEPVNGGIGGFSVICMVVSMLQNMPPVQSGDMDQRHDLGSLLMHFFDLYGNRFQHEDVALSLNPPGYIAKVSTNTPRLMIVLTSLMRRLVPRISHTIRLQPKSPSSTPTTHRTTSPAAPTIINRSRPVFLRLTSFYRRGYIALRLARGLTAYWRLFLEVITLRSESSEIIFGSCMRTFMDTATSEQNLVRQGVICHIVRNAPSGGAIWTHDGRRYKHDDARRIRRQVQASPWALERGKGDSRRCEGATCLAYLHWTRSRRMA